MDNSNREENEEDERRKLESELFHYREKYEVQQKRIQFLKRENQELKVKTAEDGKVSRDIKEQNQTLKKRNRELKSQMNELRLVMKCSNSHTGPKTATIKNILITANTEEIDLPHMEVTDEDLDSIKDFHSLKSLILGQNKISNFGMYTICNNFQNLRKLFINHNEINDDGVENIGKLKKLRCLDIRCNKITSGALKNISKLSCLSQLSISNNGIGDEGMEYLRQMKELVYLDITSNQIGEKGGLVIGELSGLCNLYLSHNKITMACVLKYLELKELKVLDVRFNEVLGEEKEELKQKRKDPLQLFV